MHILVGYCFEFEAAPGSVYLKAWRYACHLETVARGNGEPCFWLEHDAGAWWGRAFGLRFVADASPVSAKRPLVS